MILEAREGKYSLSVDILQEGGQWQEELDFDCKLLCSSTLSTIFQSLTMDLSFPVFLPSLHLEVSVLLTDNVGIRDLNNQWRFQNKATNVLAFPTLDVGKDSVCFGKEIHCQEPFPLGDIVIAWETFYQESDMLKINLKAYFVHLLIHGFLHLLGYNHKELDEALAMEHLESRILLNLGLREKDILALFSVE